MANHSIDGQTFSRDVQQERIAHGTVGGVHVTPGSIGSNSVAATVGPLDLRVTYSGTWSVTTNSQITDMLFHNAHSSTVGSQIKVKFRGSAISIIGQVGPNGGRLDVYMDGVLSAGQVNTFTTTSAQYYSLGGLNSSDTSIGVGSTSGFSASGTIIIDKEEITYTSLGTASVNGSSGPAFLGCTRGVNSTTAASHGAGIPVYAASSTVELYAAYYSSRIKLWSKTNLSDGEHTLLISIRSDRDPSSTNNYTQINGFVTGAMLGAPHIVTYLDNISVNGTTDAHGRLTNNSILGVSPDRQFLSFVSAFPLTGANWAFPMYDPTTGTWAFVTDVNATPVTLEATALYLSPPI